MNVPLMFLLNSLFFTETCDSTTFPGPRYTLDLPPTLTSDDRQARYQQTIGQYDNETIDCFPTLTGDILRTKESRRRL